MKNLIKITMVAISVMLFSAMIISAQEHNHMNKTDKDSKHMMDTKKVDKNGDGKVFECPMKCEPASDKPGECSKCGMKLVEVSVENSNKEMKCEDSTKGCCSNKSEMMGKHGDKMNHMKMNHKDMDKSKIDNSMMQKKVIDVKSFDTNNDGKVFQDQMDWDVISDKAGKCPVCGMTLKEVTINEAIENLNTHGFKTK